MLTITDGDEVMTRILGRYVGGSTPFKLFSSTPDLTITFHSDPAGLRFSAALQHPSPIYYRSETKPSNLLVTLLTPNTGLVIHRR
ncbi:hypothetical protein F7725_015042 [Dissostichus mawsoni]|uniref:Uncharacterized protein n=1 Tax=Dissostichus mawsoni TaxID=36200 RepID=A0A7J5YGI7_DISMA|nr:hypothetical protein F7725_015042 [Dissostichus mawsoni]